MSKYNMINVLMGKSADYNDKIKNGRSLKFYIRMNDEEFEKLVKSSELIDYVTRVYKKHDYVRFFVKEVK